MAAGAELGRVLRAKTETHAHFRERLTAIATATVLVDLVCSLLVYAFEHGARGTMITDYGSALFFSTTQLLTVSSSFPNPLTGAGQVLDVVMELYAITVVAALAGSTTTFLHRRSAERRGDVVAVRR
jgi:hypothetical protein